MIQVSFRIQLQMMKCWDSECSISSLSCLSSACFYWENSHFKSNQKKIIHRVKTVQFWKNVHETAIKKESIWKLACWIKKKNYLLSKSFIILFLHEQMNSAEQCCYSKITVETYDKFKCCCSKTAADEISDELHCCSETTMLLNDCFKWHAALTT